MRIKMMVTNIYGASKMYEVLSIVRGEAVLRL